MAVPVFGCNAYAGLMTTETATQNRTTVRITPVDIDTRLTLCHAYMDVVFSRHDTAEAGQAATEALAEAGRYSDRCSSRTPVLAPVGAPHPVLRRAAWLIRESGWEQNGWTGEDGSMCVLTAIRIVTAGDDAAHNDAVCTLTDRIRADLGIDRASVPVWNDSPTTTFHDVMRLLGG